MGAPFKVAGATLALALIASCRHQGAQDPASPVAVGPPPRPKSEEE